MKLRTGDPWMPSAVYAQTLKGLTLNLLVRDVEASILFQQEVLGAQVIYHDPDFAVLQAHGAEWMLHADHTYLDHPSYVQLDPAYQRGIGAEIRLHGCDPDAAQAAAERLGFRILAPAADKPYGLREAFLIDPDGYMWVPDIPAPGGSPPPGA
jgi:catechol 2,3-dioxygenase-like lactoylglutathione lyase family enzyme